MVLAAVVPEVRTVRAPCSMPSTSVEKAMRDLFMTPGLNPTGLPCSSYPFCCCFALSVRRANVAQHPRSPFYEKNFVLQNFGGFVHKIKSNNIKLRLNKITSFFSTLIAYLRIRRAFTSTSPPLLTMRTASRIPAPANPGTAGPCSSRSIRTVGYSTPTRRKYIYWQFPSLSSSPASGWHARTARVGSLLRVSCLAYLRNASQVSDRSE